MRKIALFAISALSVVAWAWAQTAYNAPGGLPSRPTFQAVNVTQPGRTSGMLLLNNSAVNGLPALQLLSAGVTTAFIGSAGTTGDLAAGSSAGDLIIRTQGGAVRISTDSGASSHPMLSSGSFTATLTGMSSVTTGTLSYNLQGNLVTLYTTANITGTSNSTSFTITGLPAAITPATGPCDAFFPDDVFDNGGTGTVGVASVGSGGSIVMGKLASASPPVIQNSGWTASGTKGLGVGWQITYAMH